MGTKWSNEERIRRSGRGSHMWKEDSKNYYTIHSWLIKNFVKPEHCEHCGKFAKRIEWALIKGFSYEKKRENFIPLCRSCHARYDFTEETRKKHLGMTFNKQPVIQIDKNGKEIARYESIKEAAKAVGTCQQVISAYFSGRLKSVKGYLWKKI